MGSNLTTQSPWEEVPYEILKALLEADMKDTD